MTGRSPLAICPATVCAGWLVTLVLGFFAPSTAFSEQDCNANGVPDPVDIELGTSADCNGSDVPDECEAVQVVLTEDLAVYPPAWTFLGDAQYNASEGDARLVHSGVEFVAGVAFFSLATDAFEVQFNFQMTNPAGGVPDGSGQPDPDGLAFIVTSPPVTAPGYNGYGLGYKDFPTASFAVEFDTFQNFVSGQPDDPDSNHVGIDVGGSMDSIATAYVTPDFDKLAGPWHARVRFVTDVVTVWATPPGGFEMEIITATIPAANIPEVKYLGFGAGTGINSADTDVDNVVLALLDQDLDGDDSLDICECEGDASGDGEVDPLDVGFVLARLGCLVGAGDPSCVASDQNGDGEVDPLDVGYVQARFGECPATGFVGIGIAFFGEDIAPPATIVDVFSDLNAGLLHVGDAITKYQGIPVNSEAELLAAIQTLPPLGEGQAVDLMVMPGGVDPPVPVTVVAGWIPLGAKKSVMDGNCTTTLYEVHFWDPVTGQEVSEPRTECACIPLSLGGCFFETVYTTGFDPLNDLPTGVQSLCWDAWGCYCEGDYLSWN